MIISHKITNISGEDFVHIYITVEDIYEFGKENLGRGSDSNLLTKLREYISNNLAELKKATAIIVINGVVIGSLTMAALYSDTKVQEIESDKSQVQVYTENKSEETKEEQKTAENQEKNVEEKEDKKTDNIEQQKEEKNSEKETAKDTTSSKTTTKKNTATTTTTKKQTTNKSQTTTTKKPTTNTNKTTSTTTTNQTTTSKPANTTTTTTQTPKPSTNTITNTNTTTTQTSGTKIKFSNGGVVTNIDLEEYVIGVVAAEMPAAFHTEALKAQAVAARTYAMNKSSKGITLVNSTSHQVYNTTAQMKAKWGSSYTTYYNKIKNAVNATKGQVLKYGGKYIEASYFSMSNGSTELPTYVWNASYPYLQVVSSPWDANLSSAKYTTTISYSSLSSKLGVTVNSGSEIKILSKTAGDRVNEISIAGKTFTGVKVRSLLGLRSADFEILKNENGVTITTQGYGHGVGMSQYGANGAAKAGYTYKQILSHYYSGATLTSI